MNTAATILAIDDVSDTLELMDRVLTSAGYRVRLADSGELALSAISASPPDLILLDVHMAGVDGFEVCRRVKASDQTRLIPIILVSGTGGPEEVAKGLRLGASDYILKPFRDEELLARVAIHLSLCRSIVSLERQAIALRQANERLQSEIAGRQRLEDELRGSLDQAERSRLAMLIAMEEQKHSEEALRAMAGMLDVAPSSITVHDPQGRFLYANSKTFEMHGYCEREFMALNLHELDVPASAAQIEERMQAIAEKGEAMFEVIHFRKDGTQVPLNVFVKQVEWRGAPAMLSIATDVTEHKRAEAEKAVLESQLQQAQKMESVGRLAGGVAHDFNNMLGVILGNAELALGQMDSEHPLHSGLQEIRSAATRSADLTRQLLAFARKQTIAPKVVNLSETVAGMLKMLHRLIGEDIDLKWMPEAEIWPVKIDPSQIDQILVNLCVNARDAIGGVGKITIETGHSTFTQEYCAAHVGFTPGDYVLLAVSDDGCGMDKEMLAHIFEPFFTTKALGTGTGLGLAMVYGVVRQNNGFVNVYSEPNHGTTFRIYLPRHAGHAELDRTRPAAAAAQGGRETILLVEDEPGILRLTKTSLERQGYVVIAAATPGEAIRLAEEYDGSIDLLMTDVVMPEMNGRVLAKNLLALYPHLKRLFMSGYTANVIFHRGVLDEGVHFIQKPFSIESLAAAVRGALDSDEAEGT